METRAILSHDEFVRLATTPDQNGWLIGRSLIFRPEIDQAEGWRDWESRSNRALTEDQRTVYALSSTIHYAHRSGGIVDWFEEDISCWNEILKLLDRLAWSALSSGLKTAIRGQYSKARSADEALVKWKKQHGTQYKDMLKQARRILRSRGAADTEDELTLCGIAMQFAEQGLMSLPDRVSDQAETFGDWLRLGDAKQQSVIRIGTWLIEHEGGLRRPD